MKRKAGENAAKQVEKMVPFDLTQYGWLGFDMDHTLAQYRLETFFPMVFDALVQFVEKEHQDVYPASLFKDLKYNRDYATKGTVFDVEHGIFINLNKQGKVCCARRGPAHVFGEDEITNLYGEDRKFKYFDEVTQFKRDFERFIPFNSGFGLPGAQLLGLMCDFVDAKEGKKQANYSQQVHHLFGAFNENYDPSALEKQRGLFFPSLTKSPELYLEKVPDSVLAFLKECQDRGQKLLLMTNSQHDFTTLVMNYVVGPDWQSKFDLIVTAAMKPTFFAEENPFEFPLDDHKELKLGALVAKGNWKELRDKMGIGKEDNKMLYFGDDINGDVLALQACEGTWDGVAIVEELGDNIHANEEHVFHCPKDPVDDMETFWFQSIERSAVCCIPSVELLAQHQQNGILKNCKQKPAEGQTKWFPNTPLELLKPAIAKF